MSLRQMRKHRPDYLWIIAVGILIMLGLVIIYSISPILSHKLLGDVSDNHFLYGQLLHICVGLLGFGLAANIHYSRWSKWLPWLILGCGLSLLLLTIPGLSISKNGATRWVGVGPLAFQPSELIKFTLMIFLATRFSQRNQVAGDKAWLKLSVAILTVLAIFVLFLQRDMGTMLIMAAILMGQFYASGVALRQVASLAMLGAGVGVSSIIMFPHRVARVLTFLDPAANTAGSGYHLNQALIAIGSGGLMGLGIGKSIQVYGYLPEAANDSIFAIVGETFGFLGALLILGLFALLIYRGLRISLVAPTRYAQLLCVGVVCWIGAQTLINMAAMLGLVPLTGVPLPFLSYGGTSLVMLMSAAGIVVNISKYTQRGAYANSARRRRDRGSYYPDAVLRPGA